MERPDSLSRIFFALSLAAFTGPLACSSDEPPPSTDAAVDAAADTTLDLAADTAADTAVDTTLDGRPDGHPDVGADGALACAAAGQSCAQSHCCLDPVDSCFLQGSGSVCAHAFPPPTQGPACNGVHASNLPGVEIVFTDDSCGYSPPGPTTTAINVHYQLKIATDIADVVAEPLDFGHCQTPDAAHGLIVDFRIEGSGHRYCLCDTGLCAGTLKTTVARHGAYDGVVIWGGHEWNGPSDTSQPQGPAFPAGTYTLTLRAKGTRLSGGKQVPFEVTATRFITLVP
jgi:hypothetical protein